MKKIAVIPARFAATRFHGKLMQKIGDKTVIRMVYENVLSMQIFDQVIVVTDSNEIMEEIKSIGGEVIKSTRNHQSGTDRVAEAVENMDVDVVVNIQGDEPFIEAGPLKSLVDAFLDPLVSVASVMKKLDVDEDINNPNIVKVVCNKFNTKTASFIVLTEGKFLFIDTPRISCPISITLICSIDSDLSILCQGVFTNSFKRFFEQE